MIIFDNFYWCLLVHDTYLICFYSSTWLGLFARISLHFDIWSSSALLEDLRFLIFLYFWFFSILFHCSIGSLSMHCLDSLHFYLRISTARALGPLSYTSSHSPGLAFQLDPILELIFKLNPVKSTFAIASFAIPSILLEASHSSSVSPPRK